MPTPLNKGIERIELGDKSLTEIQGANHYGYSLKK
jgi:hypothetical protein